jgi:hypothetical protein
LNKAATAPAGYRWLDSKELIELAAAEAAIGGWANAKANPSAFRHVLAVERQKKEAAKVETAKRRQQRELRHQAIQAGERSPIGIFELHAFYMDDNGQPITDRTSRHRKAAA